jgi:DNA-binding beta-propeller fold protein YncE
MMTKMSEGPVRATAILGAIALVGCSDPRPAPRMATTAATTADAAAPARLAFVTRGFADPAGVLYDEHRDRYLVSNVNGALPGFISVVDAQGRVVTPRAIEGDRDGATLRDPHGMGILDGLLFVADVATVRTFYVADGTPAGEIEIPGATILQDVAVDTVTGRVFVSDPGVLRAADGSDQPSGGDAVYVIEKREARPLAQGRELMSPRGLASDAAGGVWVADGDGRVYRLDAGGAMHDVARGPGKSLDGIALLGARLFVSERATGTLWERAGDRWTVVARGLTAPADLALDTKRHRLLVPSPGALEGWDF